MKTKIILFADLDGTILDKTYDFTEIHPIIRKLTQHDVAIVFNSSKTLPEVEYYRKKLRIKDPFIIENGSAIVIPKNYFKIPYQFTKEKINYNIIELGTSYSTIREKIKVIENKSNSKIIGFGDMTVKEVANDTGLPLSLACFAKDREYDEAFRIINGNELDVKKAIVDEGLYYTKGGRYFHLLGDTNKGKALIVLKSLYIKQFRKIITIGIGDGQNDEPMFAAVNKSFIVKGKKGSSWQEVEKTITTYIKTANS